MLLNNVPLSGQTLNATRGPIQNNFVNIDTSFSINHVGYTLANTGKHTYLQMEERTAPFPTTLANEVALYAKVGASSAVAELCFRRESNGTEIPFTESSSLIAPGSSGWSYLPSGFILQWGWKNIATSTKVTLSRPFPNDILIALLTCYQVGAGTKKVIYQVENNQPGDVAGASFRASSYKFDGTAYASDANYLAIGY